MFLEKPVQVLIIVEHSTISMLGYLEDTLSNVRLPNIDWNVTQMLWTKLERNTINVSQMESKNTKSNWIKNRKSVQIKNRKSNQV